MNLTARARELRPQSDCRILHYFATDGQGFQCYRAQEDLLAQPHLILRDSNGDTVLHGNAKVPFYDFRLPEARELYVNGRSDKPLTVKYSIELLSAILAPVIQTQGGADGVFIDGTGRRTISNCHYKTCGASQDQCCQFSAQDSLLHSHWSS